ncbi:carbohydrate porin [Sphingomonas ginsenosidivorax]|uniref:carbohydrate porin n=1 Tax=Sphingomonas ginsenosidivorax TaxID=862135 RepID=UPI001F548786|nr:carbohydrate porin [Sphingomonas ginsenosidivorax]
MQGIDNIELSQAATKLYEAWIEQRMATGHVALLAGLADLNAEYYQNESAGLLIAPAFGIGSELAASRPNGASIFPETALMARLPITAGKSAYLQAAAVNARTGVIGAHHTLDLSMHKGALLIVEAGHGGRIKVAAGYWRYTRRQAGAVAQGGYGLLDYPLRDGDDQGASVSLFARVGVSDGVTTSYRGGWQVGILLGGLVPRRPEEQLSFGINQGVLSTRYCTQARHGHARVSGTETGFELTYSDAVLPHLRIQPDLQYIVGASGSRNADVVVLGLRLTASFPAI